MRPPPERIAYAAQRWLSILPAGGGVQRVQSILSTHDDYSDLTPTQYAVALRWLQDHHLLDDPQAREGTGLRILRAFLEVDGPPWLHDADELVQSPEELPPDIANFGSAIGLDEEQVFQQVVSSWRKVDLERRRMVGSAGEVELTSLLERSGAGEVEHVSTWSDGFGYDIALKNNEAEAHYEVKSTSRQGRLSIYLSRHEFEVMRRDPRWFLVILRLNSQLLICDVGTVSNDWILGSVPADAHRYGSWATCKLKIPLPEVEAGIPAPKVGRLFLAPDGMALRAAGC